MPKQIIETGTVLYKKVHGLDAGRGIIAWGIVSFVATEPGFMATYEEEAPEDPADGWYYLPNRDNKCRVRAGTVLSVELYGYTWKGHETLEVAKWTSMYDRTFEYTVGTELRPTKPFDETDIACSSGIHGFLTRAEAEAY